MSVLSVYVYEGVQQYYIGTFVSIDKQIVLSVYTSLLEAIHSSFKTATTNSFV